MSGSDHSSSGSLRTGSLRRRVVLYSLAVLGLVLVVVSVLAEIFVGIQSRADLVSRLNERALLADQLASQDVEPADLVERVSGAAIRARLVTPEGTVYGVRQPSDPVTRSGRGASPNRVGPTSDLGLTPGITSHPAHPAHLGRSNSARPRASVGRHDNPAGPVVRRTLVNGAKLTLFGDSDELTSIQRRLGRLLLLLDIGGLALAGLALLGTTRAALRPLEMMTSLARSIAAGDPGAGG